MRHSLFSGLLAVSGAVAATLPSPSLAPALPLSAFPPNPFARPFTLEEINAGAGNDTSPKAPAQPKIMAAMAAAATCSNPRVRVEWDNMSDGDRQNFVSAVKCLIGKAPSGRFSNSKNRYEDFVAVHQGYTPNVHGNAKFLVWHRYFLWSFEDVLRSECGMTGPMPWFDETRYSGHFSSSSIFSSQWFGAIALQGRCVTDGQFANMALNVGPGTTNTRHCLARNGDASQTANTNSQVVGGCNARTDYADMAGCSEGGAHAWGHNGIGAVMADVYASPGDPVFWLHHGFVDRNFRIWQNADGARTGYVDGRDAQGNPLTLDTTIYMNGIRPDVKVRDVINTMGGVLCYKYIIRR